MSRYFLLVSHRVFLAPRNGAIDEFEGLSNQIIIWVLRICGPMKVRSRDEISYV